MEKIKLQNVRLSFPHIFKAKAFEEGATAKFSATAMLDPENPQHAKAVKQLKKAIEATAAEKWGKQWEAGKIKLKGTCLKAQDDDLAAEKLVTATEGEYREEQEGLYLVSASEIKRPSVVDVDRSPLAEEDGKPYAGCYVTLIITLWAQDNKFGKRINANLIGVQFKKDGEPFEGRQSVADDDWDEWDDEDEDDLMD